ncbi:hypothetical protein FH972_022119 [Carpinus fangiana]|uniref:HMG box domain-containing protein n=1 Tax=Carpinus fangiana TaxID=176857 RepID=A0A5N6KRY2_9ROSI|nr:hypothetical protein FH972_022119 [Carpinus fangiana]
MGHHEPTTYHEGDFHPDFQHLIRHNTNVAFSPEFHGASDHSLVYDSPNFQQQTGTPNMSHSFDAQHYHAEPASGVNRYEFVHGAQFPIHAVQSLESVRHPCLIPLSYLCPDADTHTQSIPSTTEVDQMAPRIVPDARRTRRGRSAARSHSPGRTDSASTRVSKPAKAKKPSKSSAKTPQLDGPLSELTKDMSIPIRDMEEWVNRPLENNHQVVSAVSGQSWPKEPPAIRDFYNGLASLERDNHAKAHPSYKFSPSKPVTFPASRRRKTSTSDADSDEYSSDGDADPDKDWIPHGGEHKTNRTTAMANRKQIQETFPAYSSHLHQPYQSNMFEVEHQLDPMLLHFDHQQTPPLDDPATPENVFGEGASRLDLSNNQGKRQSIHAPTSARGLFDDGQDDMLHHSYNERQSEFDSWMNAAHAPSPTSP